MNSDVNASHHGWIGHCEGLAVFPPRRVVITATLAILLFTLFSPARCQSPRNILNGSPFPRPVIQTPPAMWSNSASNKPPKFLFPNQVSPYMQHLKKNYHIDRMTDNARADLERVRIVCNWVNKQWKHHGDTLAQLNDPIAILEAAKRGARFSCYEYSLVTSGCLNSIGIKARTVVLLPYNVERSSMGNFHVVTEAYLRDLKKWVMVDAQFNAIPTLNRKPLSLVELQKALSDGAEGINFGNLKADLEIPYQKYLVRYLYFLYTPLDNRVIGAQNPANVTGGVMLVPVGAKPPRAFARAPVGKFTVTNALPDFYRISQP